MNQTHKEIEEEFIRESNAIEGVYNEDSFTQAMYAWEYLKTKKELTPHVIKKTHKILMLNQSLQPDQKGYFRKCPVYIGGREAFRWELIQTAIEHWCEYIVSSHNEMAIQEDHVRYEKIHPFIDGNGRTGRMFMNWQRLKAGLPILVIHEGKEQMEYYRWFK